MEITGPTSTTPQTQGELGVNGASLADTFDNFLLLLTTQLENQDPLSPMDTNQFTEQLVAFSGVEQAIKTNERLDNLIALQQGNQLTAAAGFVGRTVEAEAGQIALVDGAATVSYALAASSAETEISIVDRSGIVVRTLPGETATGLHRYTWDGTDNFGNPLPDGIYGVAVTAVDSGGDRRAIGTGTVGRVTGVEIVNGEATLSISGLKVPLSQVVSITETPAANDTAI